MKAMTRISLDLPFTKVMDIWFLSALKQVRDILYVCPADRHQKIRSDRRPYVSEVRMSTQFENVMEYKAHGFHSHYFGSRKSKAQLAMEPQIYAQSCAHRQGLHRYINCSSFVHDRITLTLLRRAKAEPLVIQAGTSGLRPHASCLNLLLN